VLSARHKIKTRDRRRKKTQAIQKKENRGKKHWKYQWVALLALEVPCAMPMCSVRHNETPECGEISCIIQLLCAGFFYHTEEVNTVLGSFNNENSQGWEVGDIRGGLGLWMVLPLFFFLQSRFIIAIIVLVLPGNCIVRCRVHLFGGMRHRTNSHHQVTTTLLMGKPQTLHPWAPSGGEIPKKPGITQGIERKKVSKTSKGFLNNQLGQCPRV